jgi:hypothetical protein
VLLPSDIPLGSKGTRHHGPASTVTRMRDALTMLVNMADKTPDIDLLPWIERELTRIVWRHCDENEARASKLLGVPAATLQSYLSAPAVKKAKKAS